MAEQIRSFRDLRVYQNAVEAAIEIFEITKEFPPEEKYSMVDQMRRSSRSICANTAEAWRKRRYRAAFIAKLNDSEGEAAETQVWLEFALRCGYLDSETQDRLDGAYERIIGQLVRMIEDADKWLIKPRQPPRAGQDSAVGKAEQ
jgi:four helix bundle protein